MNLGADATRESKRPPLGMLAGRSRRLRVVERVREVVLVAEDGRVRCGHRVDGVVRCGRIGAAAQHDFAHDDLDPEWGRGTKHFAPHTHTCQAR